ncbi:MAG: helix-turn-helix transcriptional regulator [Pyrinomonadaceae bacterium]
MDKRILLLNELILTKIKSPPDIEELAAQINISSSRLRQIFKAEMKMPFGEYVQHLQMEHARELLETTFKLIKQISVAVGFHDQSHFNHAFKEKYGLSPKKYRDENHQDLKKFNEKL